MKHVMVDLETLGTVPGCQILSIGAVTFDPRTGLIDNGFYTVVSIQDQDNYNFHVSPDTLAWWRKQSSEARKVLAEAEADDAPSLNQALRDFNAYLGAPRNVLVWGNGADFDNGILAVCYREAEVPQGWASYNGRCYRTIKNLAPSIKAVRGGAHHNALDDARTQASHMIEIVQRLALPVA